MTANMYGLVLEGGGSKGAYQIGALRALDEMNIGVGGVAGTSVGALNGAMLVQGDLNRAYELWYDISPSKIIRFSDGQTLEETDKEVPGLDLNILLRRIKKIIAEKGIDTEPLVKIIESVIDEDRIRKSPIDFGIVTFDLTDKKPIEIFKENIPQGKLRDYLIASASFPGFKPKTIDGRIYIDGAVYNNLPINLVKDKGYTDIVIIRTYGVGRKKRTDTSGLNIYNIAPPENLGPVLDFGRQRARKNLKMGYFDAIKVFRGLKGNLYYIKPLNDERYCIEYLFNLSEEKVSKLGQLFGIEKCTGKRVLFEYIIPKISELLMLPSSSSYEDILIGLMEAAAGVSGVERFKIYSAREFLTDIAAGYQPPKDDFIMEIPSRLRGIDLVSKIVKNHIIGSIASELLEDAIGRVK